MAGQRMFFDDRLSLGFELLTEAHFPDAQMPVDIYSVRLTNDGNKEIRNIKARIRVKQGQIDKINTDRSNELIEVEKLSDDARLWNFSIPLLNPEHRVTFNILARQTERVEFDALGDGVDARRSEVLPTKDQNGPWEWLSVIAGLLGALISFAALLSRDVFIKASNLVGEVKSAAVRAAIPFSSDVTRKMLVDFLQRDDLMLVFSPNKDAGEKQISFNPDGTVGKGRNQNEFKWEIWGDVVVIWDAEGRPHNRFFFNPRAEILLSTNDPDIGAIQRHGIRDQRIVPKTNWVKVFQEK